MNRFSKFNASLALGATLALLPFFPVRAESPSTQGGSQAAGTVTLRVEGMSCAACAFSVRTALKKLDGVKDAKVSSAESQAVVDYNPAKVTPEQMIDAVNKLGYKASLPAKGS